MFHLGCHLSSAAGYRHMAEGAISIGADTFQFFTRNPRGGQAKTIDPADVAAFLQLAADHHFAPILAHAPYTLNPCSADGRVRAFAYEVMQDDLQRLEHTPGSYYNFHPGSHVGQGIDAGIDLIIAFLNRILWPGQQTRVLLETMSGKGSEVGGRFGELRRIIDGLALPELTGVCLDTCHIHDAGYDVVGDLDGVLETFDREIGLDRLCAIHLNDSKNAQASHKDRHEKIGAGMLGLDAITRVICHPRLANLSFFLETPNEIEGYAEEIRLLRSIRPD
jgi:deoxyribonuclease-4